MRKEYLVKPKTVVVTTSHLGPLSCHWQSHRLMSWNNQQRSFKFWLKECWVCKLFNWISSSEERQDRARNKKGTGSHWSGEGARREAQKAPGTPWTPCGMQTQSTASGHCPWHPGLPLADFRTFWAREWWCLSANVQIASMHGTMVCVCTKCWKLIVLKDRVVLSCFSVLWGGGKKPQTLILSKLDFCFQWERWSEQRLPLYATHPGK